MNYDEIAKALMGSESSIPEESTSDYIKSAAADMWGFYSALREQGFNSDEALQLLITVYIAALQKTMGGGY